MGKSGMHKTPHRRTSTSKSAAKRNDRDPANPSQKRQEKKEELKKSLFDEDEEDDDVGC